MKYLLNTPTINLMRILDDEMINYVLTINNLPEHLKYFQMKIQEMKNEFIKNNNINNPVNNDNKIKYTETNIQNYMTNLNFLLIDISNGNLNNEGTVEIRFRNDVIKANVPISERYEKKYVDYFIHKTDTYAYFNEFTIQNTHNISNNREFIVGLILFFNPSYFNFDEYNVNDINMT